MKNLALLIFIVIQSAFPQQKYLIYFTGKGTDEKVIAADSPAYISALTGLSERSIERRKLAMGENFIRFEDLPLNNAYVDSIAGCGITIENELKWFNAVSAYLTPEQADILKNLSFVKSIEPVRTLRFDKPGQLSALYKTNEYDSLFYGSSYTQLKLSDIPKVHSRGIKGKGVLLGILDTGFRWRTHESLANARVLDEYDFIFKDDTTANQLGDGSTQDFHGTTVFSVIAGHKDSVMIGAAYEAQYILAKTEDVRSETQVEEDNYAAALIWMEGLGVDITTSSLGYSEFDGFSYSYKDMDGKSTIVTKAAELAFQRGVLTITSAGNEGQKPWFYITAPADGINTIGVGAVDSQNRVAGFSSRGPSSDGRIKPDVVAMGVNVFGASAAQVNGYGRSSGTSLAAPVAAGAAVLLKSAHPHLNNVQMRDIIIRTAGSFSFPDNEKGYGLISASAGIEYPNLEYKGGNYTVHKIFLGENVSGVRCFYSFDGKNFSSSLLAGDSIRYKFILPGMASGHVTNFYYTYISTRGDTIRVPEKNYYSVTYGELIVKENVIQRTDYILSNNYPNPFNSSTTINFILPEAGNAGIVIYDALGQKVRTLYSAPAEKGLFTVEWNGRGDDGTFCASGVYIYRLVINSTEVSKKMILMK